MASIDCVYCGKHRQASREHVLTRAFAGIGKDWVIDDAVCRHCNTEIFSNFERAWTAAPPFAEARLALGPAGRVRAGRAYTFHPAERLFLRRVRDPIAYEVDFLPRFKSRYRPQLIDTGELIISVAGTLDDVARFNARLQDFVNRPEVTIQKRASDAFRVAVLTLGPPVRIATVSWRSKPAIAWWDSFGADFEGVAHPRLSIDPDDRLRFRTRKLSEIAHLYDRALSAGSITGGPDELDPGDETISMTGVYRSDPIHRAVAKTMVNFLVDRFAPSIFGTPFLRPSGTTASAVQIGVVRGPSWNGSIGRQAFSPSTTCLRAGICSTAFRMGVRCLDS